MYILHFNPALSHPLYEGSLIQQIIIPQDDVSTLGAHCNSGGMGGMPFQTSDPPIEGAGCAVKFVGFKWAYKRLLQTL